MQMLDLGELSPRLIDDLQRKFGKLPVYVWLPIQRFTGFWLTDYQ